MTDALERDLDPEELEQEEDVFGGCRHSALCR